MSLERLVNAIIADDPVHDGFRGQDPIELTPEFAARLRRAVERTDRPAVPLIDMATLTVESDGKSFSGAAIWANRRRIKHVDVLIAVCNAAAKAAKALRPNPPSATSRVPSSDATPVSLGPAPRTAQSASAPTVETPEVTLHAGPGWTPRMWAEHSRPTRQPQADLNYKIFTV